MGNVKTKKRRAVSGFSRPWRPPVRSGVLRAAGPTGARLSFELGTDPDLPGMRIATLDLDPLPAPVGTFTIFVNDMSIWDLVLVVTWKTA